MKLFITNKLQFENDVNNIEYSKSIHKLAFNQLSANLAKGYIPLSIHPVSNDFFFNFVKKDNDIYYYEYSSLDY